MKIEVSNERLKYLFEEYCIERWDDLDKDTQMELGVRYPAEPDVGLMTDHYEIDGREEEYFQWCADNNGFVECFLNDFWDDGWLKSKDLLAISLLDDADREEFILSVKKFLEDWGE